jgi:hypothetical protein
VPHDLMTATLAAGTRRLLAPSAGVAGEAPAVSFAPPAVAASADPPPLTAAAPDGQPAAGALALRGPDPVAHGLGRLLPVDAAQTPTDVPAFPAPTTDGPAVEQAPAVAPLAAPMTPDWARIGVVAGARNDDTQPTDALFARVSDRDELLDLLAGDPAEE